MTTTAGRAGTSTLHITSTHPSTIARIDHYKKGPGTSSRQHPPEPPSTTTTTTTTEKIKI